MITNKELEEVTLSPTKKDYYQIWNELMELSAKISDRWTPETTNESDPGVVLLKVLTAVGDMLNYNVDVNTLETQLTSATQVESVRELTSRMGYDMKHYQAATCEVAISYTGDNSIGDGIYFPRFINLKNEDEDVNYITWSEFTLTKDETRSVTALEGTLVTCETDNDGIVALTQLDDLQRYYFNENNVAENGIIITNISDTSLSAEWKKVTNLNTQLIGSKVYKFGYDSKTNLPYVQFPADIANLIEDGLSIQYVRTSGYSGNISAYTLCKLEPAAIWSTSSDTSISSLSADSFKVSNITAATNGADPESITSAYNNFKKTIGTFDTLVTCRDYMNKIYQLTVSDYDTTPLVSNVIVTDIRNDINNAVTLCSFEEYGICYSTESLKSDGVDKISQFDLILYPFTTVRGINNKSEYKESFNYSAANYYSILNGLDDCKTISHNIRLPQSDDITCIKNYVKLQATITTNKRVTTTEETEILNTIYTALYKNFNARQLDFGEEINTELIYDVIKKADPRIKDVNNFGTTVFTKIKDYSGTEYEVVATGNQSDYETGDQLYNKLVLRNILAGRLAMFDYDTTFKHSYEKTSGTTYSTLTEGSTEYSINRVSSQFKLTEADIKDGGIVNYTLLENEVIQFKTPNFKTDVTYPAYVNYFIKLNQNGKQAIAATMESIPDYFIGELDGTNETYPRWNAFVNSDGVTLSSTTVTTSADVDALKLEYGAVFELTSENKYKSLVNNPKTYDSSLTLYYFNVTAAFGALYKYITNLKDAESGKVLYPKLYRSLGINVGIASKVGKLIGSDLTRYTTCTSYPTNNIPANYGTIYGIYLPKLHPTDCTPEGTSSAPEYYTADGLGRDAEYAGLTPNSNYKLKEGEYLLINYTSSEDSTVKNQPYYGGNDDSPIYINANFNLVDSVVYNSTHSYPKTTGYLFTEPIDGMFTLGTDEQICIMKPVKVELNVDKCYVYWERKDDIINSDNTFNYNESYNGTSNCAYTLKEGEYFYYAGSTKTDMAYYGCGTTIIKSENTPSFTKYAENGTATNEEILTYGITAVPWVLTQLNDVGDTKRHITIIENQLITLTEGDTLTTVTFPKTETDDATETSESADQESIIDSTWRAVKTAKYKFADSDTPEELPTIPEGLSWSVKSRLNINLGPDHAQVLHGHDALTLSHMSYEDGVPKETIVSATIKGNDTTPEYVQCDYECEAAADFLDIKYQLGNLIISDVSAKFYAAKHTSVQMTDSATTDPQSSETLILNNYSDNWTKVAFGNYNAYTSPYFELQTSIPAGKFGLIMFYHKKESDTESVKLTAYKKNGTTETEIAGICRYNTANPDSLAATYTLVSGINVIKVSPDVTKLKVQNNIGKGDTKTSIVVFSDLDIINGINPKLNYHYSSTKTSALDQLCEDIRTVGFNDKFYYNIPVANTTAIDLNEYIADETVGSPSAWYDKNNVNNNFVISEISADDLPFGIVLSKASKR